MHRACVHYQVLLVCSTYLSPVSNVDNCELDIFSRGVFHGQKAGQKAANSVGVAVGHAAACSEASLAGGERRVARQDRVARL